MYYVSFMYNPSIKRISSVKINKIYYEHIIINNLYKDIAEILGKV